MKLGHKNNGIIAKRFKCKIEGKDIVLLKQYRIKCLNNKIKQYSGLLISAGGLIASVLFDLPIIGMVSFIVVPIILALFIFSKS